MAQTDAYILFVLDFRSDVHSTSGLNTPHKAAAFPVESVLVDR